MAKKEKENLPPSLFDNLDLFAPSAQKETAEDENSSKKTEGSSAKSKKQKAEVTKKTTSKAQPQIQTTTARSQSKASQKATSKQPEPTRPTVHMREISLGGQITEEPPEAVEERAMDENTAAPEEQKPYSPGTAAGAAGTAIAAAGVGGAFRYRRFRQIIKGWTRRP